jgi:hypothetical protein
MTEPRSEQGTQAIIQDLRRRYPEGLSGEREQLVTALMNDEGLEHAEALKLADRLRAEGFAHHLPGAQGRWMFTTRPVSLQELMHRLDESYESYTFEGGSEREELLGFLGSQMGLDRDVAEEVLTGLEHAGYTSVVYQEEIARNRMFLAFPEAFRTGV